MQIPEVLIDAYREQEIITDPEVQPNRKVRVYTREQMDTTNPVLVEFYKKNAVYEAIDPLIANAVHLDYNANSYIDAVKSSDQYSYFIVFNKGSDINDRYVTAIAKSKNINDIVKRFLENSVFISKVEEIETFINDYSEIPEFEYEELAATLEIQSTKDTIMYVDEPFTAKCFIYYHSGESDWFPYKYTWNVISTNAAEISVAPIEFPEDVSEYKRNLICEVEFRLKEQPTNTDAAVTFRTQTAIKLNSVPAPSEMTVDVLLTSDAGETFYIDHIYRVQAQLSNLSGGYSDWELREVEWNITPSEGNMYEATFTPTEKRSYQIEARATYMYKRDNRITCSFEGTYVKQATYMPISGNVSVEVTSHKNKVIVGDKVELRARTSNIEGLKSPITGEDYGYSIDYVWTNAEIVSNLNKAIAQIPILGEDNIEVSCDVVYTLREDSSVNHTIHGSIILTPETIQNMRCDLVVTPSKDISKDPIRMGEMCRFVATPTNVGYSSEWEEVGYTWTGMFEADNTNSAFFKSEVPGYMPYSVVYKVRDIYSGQRTLEYSILGSVLVEYKTDTIGTCEMTVSGNGTVHFGERVKITAEYTLNPEIDDLANWSLESIVWSNNVTKDSNSDDTGNTSTRYINSISNSKEVVKVTFTFKHALYPSVVKTLENSVTIMPQS